MFVSPDTIVPEPYDALDWQGYLYVRGNPLRYVDPSGHRIDDGCSTEGCSLTQKEGNDNARKEAEWLAENERLKCLAGDQAHCGTSTAMLVGFAVAGLIFVGIAPEIPALVDLLGWQALALCAQNPICWSLIVARTPSLQSGNKNLPGIPDIGRKLDYLLGKATGREHNLLRSQEMLRQLKRIGLFDNDSTRQYLLLHLSSVVNDPSNIVRVEQGGRVVRESLLMGPNGGVKIQSIWIGAKLITVIIFGGG